MINMSDCIIKKRFWTVKNSRKLEMHCLLNCESCYLLSYCVFYQVFIVKKDKEIGGQLSDFHYDLSSVWIWSDQETGISFWNLGIRIISHEV